MAVRGFWARHVLRREKDRALDWIGCHHHDPAETFVLVAGFLLVTATTLIILVLIGRDSRLPVGPSIANPRIEAPGRALVSYTNTAGAYRFRYPSEWDLVESAAFARLQSPGGNTLVTFGSRRAEGLEATSARLVESLPVLGLSKDLIGTKQERIADSRSLLTGGTGRDLAGRSVRFLVIAIRGDRRNYAVSIIVPATLIRIVSSRA